MKPEPLTGQRTLERHFRPYLSYLSRSFCSSLSLGWSSTALASAYWGRGLRRRLLMKSRLIFKTEIYGTSDKCDSCQRRWRRRRRAKSNRRSKKQRQRELLGQTMFKQFHFSSVLRVVFALHPGNFLVFTLKFVAPSNFTEILLSFLVEAIFL